MRGIVLRNIIVIETLICLLPKPRTGLYLKYSCHVFYTVLKQRSESVTLSDPCADPFAQFNAWLLSNTTDVLNSSISDFDFPSVCLSLLVNLFEFTCILLRKVTFAE